MQALSTDITKIITTTTDKNHFSRAQINSHKKTHRTDKQHKTDKIKDF